MNPIPTMAHLARVKGMHELIIEARRPDAIIGGHLEVSGVVLLSRVAGHPGSLQADCHRCGLGSGPALVHDVDSDGGFGRLAKMPSGGVPYPILVFSAVLPWYFFSSAMAESGNSLLNNRGMVSKVDLPRMVVPASSVITSFVDFLVSCVIMVAVMAWYGFAPSANCVFLPWFIALAFGASFGAGLFISAAMVQYRDFRFIVPFVVQFGTYLSPVGFQSSVVPEQWRLLYSVNPMVGVIDGFRWAILGGEQTLYWPAQVLSRCSSWRCWYSPGSPISEKRKGPLPMSFKLGAVAVSRAPGRDLRAGKSATVA